MHKILKFPWENRNKHYWSSDFHVFHDPKTWTSPIWEVRGYRDAFEASEQTLRLINETIKEDDILWYLGDMFLNATDGECVGWLNKINCKNIYKLWGNHTSNTYRLYKEEVLKQFGRDDIEVYPLKMGNITFLGNHQEIQIGKQFIVMNHFPLRIHHKSHIGSWNLSGHSHLNDPLRRPEYPLAKGMDVGIDSGVIWSFEEIAEIMSTKTVELIDHHDRDTN